MSLANFRGTREMSLSTVPLTTVMNKCKSCSFIWMSGFSGTEVVLDNSKGLYMLTKGSSVLVKYQEHVLYTQEETLYSLNQPSETRKPSEKNQGCDCVLLQNQGSYPVLFLLITPLSQSN